jgi:cytolysin (calcineurin-like family phosphatase)
MKKGVPGANESDLNKDNIIKPTLDYLSEEGQKALEVYHREVDDIFLSPYKVTRYVLIQKDAAPINICNSEVTPEV